MVDKAHADSVRVIGRRTIVAPEATDHVALVVDVVDVEFEKEASTEM